MTKLLLGAKKALEASTHSLDECTLEVREKKAELSENDKIFVEGISTTTTRDGLKYYVERISDLETKEITYGTRNNKTVNAIVTFTSSIGEFGNDLTRSYCKAIIIVISLFFSISEEDFIQCSCKDVIKSLTLRFTFKPFS